MLSCWPGALPRGSAPPGQKQDRRGVGPPGVCREYEDAVQEGVIALDIEQDELMPHEKMIEARDLFAVV